MITIFLNGGLGNQMFQYALYKSMLMQGIDVQIDDYRYYLSKKEIDPNLPVRTNELGIFDIEYNKCSDFFKKMIDLHYSGSKILAFLISKLVFKKIIYDPNKYDPEIYNLKDGYLNGYWQCEKYFEDEDIQRQLREDFKMSKKYVKSNDFIEMEKKIKDSNAVCLHIRRGDYLGLKSHNVCTEQYYEKAIDYIKSKVDNPVFFVFSDDKDYISDKYGNLDNYVIVNRDNRLSDTDEFFLMSYCRHFIMANSTFSWWAAWLNENPDKIRVVPEPWLKGIDFSQIYTDDMYRIKV